MTTFERTSELPATAGDLFDWHARAGAFERLVPPWERVDVIDREGGGIDEGSTVTLRMKRGPFRLKWVARHRDVEPGRQFRDEQVKGPFKRWVHTHRFEPLGEERSALVDEIDYALPFGPLGRLFGGRRVSRDLERTFTYRHRQTQRDIERHARAGLPPQRVVISGASGLIGTALTSFLTTGGHEVRRLVRRKADEAAGEIAWNPANGELDAADLEGTDVVVNLAGANVGDGRWTEARKRLIRDSRVDSTRLLASRLAALDRKPRVLISASAVGIYGHRPDEVVDERSSLGDGFLTDVCKDWEAATEPAEEAGIRVVHARIGVVLTSRGGALAKMLTPFKLGAGGPVGNGRQGMSWIALDDVVGVMHHLMADDSLSGPVNLAAPNPVDNRTFGKTLGRVLRRPAVMPLPAFAIKTLFGEMGQTLLLEGARVMPQRLLESGFEFEAPDLESALREELGR